VIWLSDDVLFGGGLFSGIICLGSATYYHRMSDFAARPLQIFSTYPRKFHAGYCVYFPVKELNYENAVHLNNNLYVTDPYRTICDLIEYNRKNDLVYQCFNQFPDGYSFDKLFEYAEKRGMSEKVRCFYETYERYFDELAY